MAEFIFNDLATERGLPFIAESAGVRARPGYDMAENAREALEEIGVEAPSHVSRKVTGKMAGDYDLVLTMSELHSKYTSEVFGSSKNIHILPKYAEMQDGRMEVADPYGLPLLAYRTSVRNIYGYVENALDRFEKDST